MSVKLSLKEALEYRAKVDEFRNTVAKDTLTKVLNDYGLTNFVVRKDYNANGRDFVFVPIFLDDKEEFLYNLKGEAYFYELACEEFMRMMYDVKEKGI